MRRWLATFTTILAVCSSRVSAQSMESVSLSSARTLQDSLIAMERLSWVAWKDHDASYFQNFLSDDHVDVGGTGIIPKMAVVGFLQRGGCRVESYAIDSFKFARLSDDAALVTYRAEQNTTCGGAKVPSPAWSSAVYVRREGKWTQALFQQTVIEQPPKQ